MKRNVILFTILVALVMLAVSCSGPDQSILNGYDFEETNLFDAVVIGVEKMNQPLIPSLDVPDENVYMADLEIPELGRIKVTTDDDVKPGEKVIFAIRPEKIVISKERPATKREDINLFQGKVDELIHSDIQTKFCVKISENTLIRVIKQHAGYPDEGPDIVWKDSVYLSWSANDGYIVEVKKP